LKYFEQEKLYGEVLYIEDVPKTAMENNIINEPEEIIQMKKKETPGNINVDKPMKVEILEVVTNNEPQKPVWHNATDMIVLNDLIKDCLNCRLGSTRKNFVFGSGNPNADIMFIGEAPGADEDAQGLPFVGRAGQLLTKILEAINLKREEVYICNINKCRPPDNRKPFQDEVDACLPYLLKQIELVKPVYIVALGATAVDGLFKYKGKMGDIRGKIMEFHGVKTLVTYHPSALLHNPNLKRDVWEDVKVLRKLYDEYLESFVS